MRRVLSYAAALLAMIIGLTAIDARPAVAEEQYPCNSNYYATQISPEYPETYRCTWTQCCPYSSLCCYESEP